jgi:hypothetical protein
MLNAYNAPEGDGFATHDSLLAAVLAGRRALSDTDNPGLIDEGPVDAVANVLLAALVDADEADAPRHWSEVRQLVGRIVDRAVDHALADYCNIADSAETQDRLGLR